MMSHQPPLARRARRRDAIVIALPQERFLYRLAKRRRFAILPDQSKTVRICGLHLPIRRPAEIAARTCRVSHAERGGTFQCV